jgi:hypothetical protein
LNKTFIREWTDPEGSLPPGLQPASKFVPGEALPAGAHRTSLRRSTRLMSAGSSGMVRLTPESERLTLNAPREGEFGNPDDAVARKHPKQLAHHGLIAKKKSGHQSGKFRIDAALRLHSGRTVCAPSQP